MLLLTLSLLILFFLRLGEGHKEIKTEHEREVQRALQAAAYHCAPTVAQFTAARQRTWAQRVLAGRPSLLTLQALFNSESYDAIDATDESLLSCTSLPQQTHIRNNTCVLAPEVTEGPYFHYAEHPIRQNIAELQDGLLLLLDIGVIDVETCQPLPNVLVDIWQTNATGFYGGYPVRAPHLIDEKPQVGGRRAGLLTAFPRTTYDETFLRGAWPTNEHGVAQFTTIFPGYYTGRATHIHAKVYMDWTTHLNGSYSSSSLVHVGQFFFDDEINIRIDNMHPYTENPIRNTYGRTRNWRDGVNIFGDSHGPEGKYNPVFELDLLGGVISQGLIGYITMGVNASARYDNVYVR